MIKRLYWWFRGLFRRRVSIRIDGPPVPRTEWVFSIPPSVPPTTEPFTWETLKGIEARAPARYHVAGRLNCGAAGEQARSNDEVNCLECCTRMGVYLSGIEVQYGPCAASDRSLAEYAKPKKE